MNEELRAAFTDEAMIRYDAKLDVFVTWNGSATFNVIDSEGEAIDVFTLYGRGTNAGPCTPSEAYDAIVHRLAAMHEAEVNE